MLKTHMPHHADQSDEFEYDVNYPLTLFKYLLKAKGITNIDDLSEHLYNLYQLKHAAKIYHHNDVSLKKSSDTEAMIMMPDGSEHKCIIWCVNHYLGLNRNPEVIARAKATLDEYGTGSGTSAFSGGLSGLHSLLSEKLAKMVGKEKAVLYPTGYTANLGAISAMTIDNDLIITDSQCHASIMDGCRLSGKKVIHFQHNDAANLEEKLKKFSKEYTNIFVIVESVYSMDGDVSPIKEIVALKEKYKFLLYVDEAHSLGFYGENGKGYCNQLGVTDQVDFIMGTLSKATASIGGYVACKAKYALLLTHYANAYIFQATMPPANVATAIACLDIIESNPELIQHLHSQANYFKTQLQELGFDILNSTSPVIPLMVKDNNKLSQMYELCIKEGIYSIPVIYPAVAKDKVRFRFIVTAAHTKAQIDHTVGVLQKLGKQFGLI